MAPTNFRPVVLPGEGHDGAEHPPLPCPTCEKGIAMHNTSEVLNTAADLIEKRGWYSVSGRRTTPWQSDCWGRIDSDDAFCLEGGIAAALGIDVRAGGADELTRCPAFLAVEDYLDGVRPMHFNDNPKRTQSEVIATLRAAALIEAAREEQDAAWSTYTDCVTS